MSARSRRRDEDELIASTRRLQERRERLHVWTERLKAQSRALTDSITRLRIMSDRLAQEHGEG
jgi:hypothetical protein